jgi:hypothetical protein
MGAAITILGSFMVLSTVWDFGKFYKNPSAHLMAQYMDYTLRVLKMVLDMWISATFFDVFSYFLALK